MGEKLPERMEDPIWLIQNEHSMQKQLCDLLEQIADCLPDNVSSPLAQAAMAGLEELYRHHRHEEDFLFPLIKRRAEPRDNIDKIIEHLVTEHAIDESLAGEVFENLENIANGQRPKNPDMLGYMLRAFFESYRRHIIWEDTILFPLIRERLHDNDLEELVVMLEEEKHVIVQARSSDKA